MASIKRTFGSATILAIGTANPANYIFQTDFPDYYFRVTKNEHQTELKKKVMLMCENSMIRKRHFHLTKSIISKNPSIASNKASSLDARQNILTNEVPLLAKEAAKKAIDEWGQPESKITHLVFSALAGVDMPGLDCQLIRLLGLKSSIKRIMMYHQGCYVGGTLLCIAKDIAESNPEARILLVTCDMTIGAFREPSLDDLSCVAGQVTVGDGAAALIIGSGHETPIERPLFHIISATQEFIPDSQDAVQGHLCEMGLTMYISKDYPILISENIEQCLVRAFSPIGLTDWNSLFWILHPGGAPILKSIEAKLKLGPEKLAATRRILSEYGNMGGPSVFFVLDEMRKRSVEGKRNTTGEGMEWGVLFAYGAGIYLDAIVLRSVPLV